MPRPPRPGLGLFGTAVQPPSPFAAHGPLRPPRGHRRASLGSLAKDAALGAVEGGVSSIIHHLLLSSRATVLVFYISEQIGCPASNQKTWSRLRKRSEIRTTRYEIRTRKHANHAKKERRAIEGTENTEQGSMIVPHISESMAPDLASAPPMSIHCLRRIHRSRELTARSSLMCRRAGCLTCGEAPLRML